MNASLGIVRYLLIVVPAVATLYLSSLSAYSTYTLCALLFIWLVQLREKFLPDRAKPLALWAEAVFAFWFAHEYGGILYMLPFSTAISAFAERDRFGRWMWAAILFILLNALAASRPIELRLALNLAFAGWTACLNGIREASSGMRNAELYNDELRRKHYELEAARKTILDYAGKVEKLAQIEERNRISREIHDELGHRLVRLKMMMDAACAIQPSQAEKGLELMRKVRDQLAESMDMLRHTVRKMKPEEAVKQKYSLAALIEELGRTNGIEVSFETSGMPYPLYPSEEIALYRNAQEAVTNAIRHGNADRFRIRLEYGERSVAMTVFNNGAVPDSIPRKGLGVTGMEERVKLLGGTVSFSLDDEFAVTTVIPRQRQPADIVERSGGS